MKDGCKFIAGDPHAVRTKGDKVFCGDERKPGSSYCPAHHARCWQQVKPKVVEKTAEHAAL